MSKMQKFIGENFGSVLVIVCFLVTFYVQHVVNTANVAAVDNRCAVLETKLDDQYKKIDAIKLDKSVFEATMKQFVDMRDDMREMRADVKELLKGKK